MKRYYIRTFGCQMNVADSESMAGILEARGLSATDDPRRADVIVVNTCTIRRKAEEKAFSELGRMVRLKGRGREVVVAAAGCVARQRGASMLARLPGLDLVLGPGRIQRLGEALDERAAAGRAVVDVADAQAPSSGAPPSRQGGVTAFVSIMRGCDNRCAYCVVPGVRGPESSRPPADIERELRELVGQGFREVTLLGQNVNSYGKGLRQGLDFPGLLELLDRRTGIARLRFTTSHPKDFTRRLAEAVRDLPSVCEWVHLPVQAGSDRVLAAMNRGYGGDDYRRKVEMLREVVPQAAVSTDIIVGFPGESEGDFDETLRLVRDTRFAGLFAFKFSPREGTPAAALAEDVSPAEKDRRLQEVLAAQKAITLELHRLEVGRVREVLVEGPDRIGGGLMSGRTRGNRVVNFPGPGGLAGQVVRVRITRAGPNSLGGELEAKGPVLD